ncbi:MAG: glycine cleavage system protein GcvH [Acidimicrobiia bacterium]
MSDIPTDRRYTADHEWVRIESEDADGTRARIGISDFAQDALGDIVFVDLPEVDREVSVGETIAEVESTKSVGEVYAAVSGRVVAVNEALTDEPELVNAEPYGRGWIVEVRLADPGEFEELLTADAYEATLG